MNAARGPLRGRIESSAPGKLVLCGEYAVLAGAPALAAAVDRRVACTLSARGSGGWRFETSTHAPRALSKDAVFRAPSDTLPGIVRAAIDEADAPQHLAIAVDSSSCYRDGEKLGVGSSAALAVAVGAAFAALRGRAPRLADFYRIHARFQGGGSGIDVAAAAIGGAIRFQQRRAAPVRLPPLETACVFAGVGTRTGELVARFDAWRAGGIPPPLERLADAAAAALLRLDSPEAFLDALGVCIEALERLDRASGIGIFGPAHRAAMRIAADCGVLYKPCGAGGGDTGAAFSTDADAIAAFARRCAAAGLALVPMAFAAEGVAVRAVDG